MRGNREYKFYLFGIASYEIECLINTSGMCCYADFGDGEVA
jgi:hypothetical protein